MLVSDKEKKRLYDLEYRKKNYVKIKEAKKIDYLKNRTSILKRIKELRKKFIKQWNSIKEAASELKINPSSITQNLRNKSKTAGSFIWRYNINAQ
jgi:hypothetical protein